jgi:hypothetical protein
VADFGRITGKGVAGKVGGRTVPLKNAAMMRTGEGILQRSGRWDWPGKD